MNIANVPVIGKVLLILSLFGAFTVGATVFSGKQMVKIETDYSRLIDEDGMAAFQLARASRAFVQAGSAIGSLLISNTSSGNEIAEANFKEARAYMAERFDNVSAALPKQAGAVDALKASALAVLDRDCARTLELARAATSLEAIMISQQEYLDSCGGQLEPVRKAISALSNELVDRQAAGSTRLTEI